MTDFDHVGYFFNIRFILNPLRYNNLTNTHQTNSCNDEDPNYISSIATGYKNIHGYFALIVCVFGAVANLLIMMVLRRREMASPVNLMLFALALADLLIMVEYIPFAIHMYIMNLTIEERYSYPAALFVFFHVHFTQILHTISIQLVSVF